MESQPVSPTVSRVELGPDRLASYIPDEQGSLIAVDPTGPSGAFSEDEKQQIIKAIFYLKQEVDALKSMVENGRKAESLPQQRRDAPHIIGMSGDSRPENFFAKAPSPVSHDPVPAADTAESHDLSIRKLNDELIERCLAKHGGKVKPAAAELGISERTIYRKLAEKRGK